MVLARKYSPKDFAWPSMRLLGDPLAQDVVDVKIQRADVRQLVTVNVELSDVRAERFQLFDG